MDKPTNNESYLPNWLLDLKQNISTSKQLYSQTSERIEGLKCGVLLLGSRINEIGPRKSSDQVKNPRTIFLHHLPIDTLIIIVRFLDVKSVVIFLNVSKFIHALYDSSELWQCYFQETYPNINLRNSNICKRFIIQQAQFGETGLKFIRLINSNRSLTRGRSFELNLKEANLSRVETMTKDFRSFALMSLRALYSITCHECSPIFQSLLIEGIIRVLISLLSNESSLIQQFSCDIISNMLSWESLIARKNIPSLDIKPVSAELQICDGRRQLLSLLTSPSAAVVLSQRIQHDHPYRMENFTESARGMKTTSSVQGVANKSASRALVNYFCFEYPIFSAHREILFTELDDDIFLSKSHSLHIPHYLQKSATPWKFLYYHRSGFLKDIYEIWILFSCSGKSFQGRGIDEFGPFILKGEAEFDFGDAIWYIDKYHLQTPFFETSVEPLSTWIENQDSIWLSADDIWAMGKKSVTHVGYRSSGFRGIEEGLWGVWEIASTGSHYELQKGGVFRAIALVEMK